MTSSRTGYYYLVVSSPPAMAWSLTLWAFIWLSELKFLPHLSHLKPSCVSGMSHVGTHWIYGVSSAISWSARRIILHDEQNVAYELPR